MFLSVIFLLKKRNFLSFLSFELLWERLPKHTPVLRRFLLIDFQWLDFKKLMQFCPAAERRGAHTVGSALHLSLSPQPCDNQNLFSLWPFSRFKEGRKRIFWSPLIWASLKSHWKIYHRLWEQRQRCPMSGLGGNLGTTAPFINFTKIEASKTTVYLTFLKQNNHSRMGSLSNRDFFV